MTEGDTIFRWIAALVLVSCLAISTFHRLRARRSGQAIPRRAEGAFALAARTIVGVPLFLGPLLYIANPAWMSWASIALPVGLRWAGAVLGVVLIPAMVWVFRSLGRNVSETVLTKTDHALVTHGPYRWVRHPLYTAAIMLFLALGLMASNGFILLLSVIAAALIRLIVVPREERELEKKFGDAYRSYARGTGAMLPRFTSG